tara:strand:- start:45241 stop:49824 length:4584 start_codon:yes stop_codon:yes gene_type:complete
MATYLQGVTDYVPQVQPWRPNYNFYQPIFQQKQAKYDQGWNKVNNMYNSMLNAPMLREDNKLHRDEFFKNAEQQIKQISGLDLSLVQNIDAASQVFAPFYDDEGIVKDMGFTKKYQDQMQRSEYLRNCNDEKCADKYWNGGVRAMNYQAEDFVSATAEEALKMRAPQYTENYNLMKNAQAAVKDAGLSMKITRNNGQYLVTDKNGSQLTMPLMSFMMQRFGDDPKLQEFYSTKAMLLTRENPEAANAAYKKAMQNPEMSKEQIKEESENEAFDETYNSAKNVVSTTANQEQNRFLTMVKKKNVLEAKIKKEGIVPGSSEANSFVSIIRDNNIQEKVVNGLNEMDEKSRNTDIGLQEKGLAANKDQMRNVIANAMKINDMYKTANTLAYQDYEHTMVADPFAVQNNSYNNSKKLAEIRNGYAMTNNAYDYIYKKSLKEIDNAIKNKNVGTGLPFFLRPSNNYSDRLRDFTNTGSSLKGPSGAGSAGDQLAASILAGMSNPQSNVSMQPERVAMLVDQGKFEEALNLIKNKSPEKTPSKTPSKTPKSSEGLSTEEKPYASGRFLTGSVSTGGFDLSMNLPLNRGNIYTPPDISYKVVEGKDGFNVMKSTLARYGVLKDSRNHDYIPFNYAMFGDSDGDSENPITFDHQWATINIMRGAFAKSRGYTAERVNHYKKDAEQEKSRINIEQLNQQFAMAGDDSNPNKDAMQAELLELTTTIDQNFVILGKKAGSRFGGNISKSYPAYKKASDAGWGGLPKLTAEEFKTMRSGLPTNFKNTQFQSDSKQYRKIKGIGNKKLIALAGGIDALYQFNENAGGIWSTTDANPNEVSRLTTTDESKRPAKELMSHNEYSKWATLISDEAGNLNNDGTYVNKELTPDILAKVKRYEAFTSNTNYERKWGMGSKLPEIQYLNAVNAPHKVGIKQNEDAAQIAIDNWNASLNEAQSNLVPQTRSIDGRIWNSIMDKIVIPGGQGEMSRIATKTELSSILAESIPELLEDPSWFEDNEPFTGTWGPTFNRFMENNMSDGSPGKKALLNLLSVSNYASIDGASKGNYKLTAAGYGYNKPSWEQVAPGFNKAIAGWKMNQDDKLPFDQRKYKSMADALEETRAENPYTGTTFSPNRDPRVVQFGNGMGNSEDFDPRAQRFLQFLGKYEGALTSKQSDGEKPGSMYNVSPNYSMYEKYKKESDPRTDFLAGMDFDFAIARMDRGWDNIFTDHEATIGTAYEEIINGHTNGKSSFGGMFTGEDGAPRGQGTMLSLEGNMSAITPYRQDQNFIDSKYILDEAVKKGDFTQTESTGAVAGEQLTLEDEQIKTVLNQLSGDLKSVDTYTKGHEPIYDLSYQTFDNAYNKTKFTLTFLGPNWLKDKGYNNTKTGQEKTARPMSYTWTVEDPTDALSKGAHPTSWDATVGNLGVGETYTNSSIAQNYGSIHYTKESDGMIQPGYTIDLFNVETGEDEEVSIYAPAQAYYGTDWIDEQIKLVDVMTRNKAVSEDMKRKYTMLRGVKSTDELLEVMAKQIGVSVEELVESFK